MPQCRIQAKPKLLEQKNQKFFKIYDLDYMLTLYMSVPRMPDLKATKDYFLWDQIFYLKKDEHK